MCGEQGPVLTWDGVQGVRSLGKASGSISQSQAYVCPASHRRTPALDCSPGDKSFMLPKDTHKSDHGGTVHEQEKYNWKQPRCLSTVEGTSRGSARQQKSAQERREATHPQSRLDVMTLTCRKPDSRACAVWFHLLELQGQARLTAPATDERRPPGPGSGVLDVEGQHLPGTGILCVLIRLHRCERA